MDWLFLLACFQRLLRGLPLTLELTGFSCLAGFILAWLLAAMRLSGLRILDYPARLFVEVFRGTPLLVQLFVIYYGFGQFSWLRESVAWHYLREAYWCALLALTLNTAAYASEVFRGGVLSVARHQKDAARALGMTGAQVFHYIVLPLAWRQMLPAYGNEIILMVKSTSLASVVTLMEITGIAAKLISESYRPIEVFLCAGVMYLLLNFMITRGITRLERRLNRSVKARG